MKNLILTIKIKLINGRTNFKYVRFVKLDKEDNTDRSVSVIF